MPQEVSNSSRDKLAAIVLAAIALSALILFIFVSPSSGNPAVLPVVRFLAAIASALSAFLFIGTLSVSGTIPLFEDHKLGVQAAGSFAVFIVVFALFFYGIPHQPPNPSQSSHTVASPVETIKPAERKPTKQFSETITLAEHDVAIVSGVKIATRFIGLGGRGAWVDVSAADGSWERLEAGGSFRVIEERCPKFNITVKDVSLSAPAGVSQEQIREMGIAAESLISRGATIIAYGECEI